MSHTTQDLVFIWNMTDPLVVNPEIELPQLDISNNYTTDCTIEYSTGNFTCIQIVFNLKRRLGYHLFHTYIPSALIVVMSWIAFWIKPEAIPARVTLGVTSLLTLGECVCVCSLIVLRLSAMCPLYFIIADEDAKLVKSFSLVACSKFYKKKKKDVCSFN